MTYLLAMALLGTIGCSWESGPDLHAVTGNITKDGVPFTNASLEFYPKGPGAPSYGKSDEDGNFTLRYSTGRPGAIEGEHLVTVIGGQMKKGVTPVKKEEHGLETLVEGEAAPAKPVANPEAKGKRRGGGGGEPESIQGIPAMVSAENDNHVVIEL
ncbi:hypothetical protein [Blastopirellula marina]|uniref:Carboxypeptidase regulatory-like domain-containing protein n=1 Tax=Blastopirellula marina TaxID=124 RepID=A0A2S8FWU2_9BACT|nr:hypothetical protein [Blastopirellula marina]PQO36652.1 hypothetical protein C5Y98_11700 [Blastopirellula marina]PTL44482.1 hypothetical protein C5Y97_11710 [Blastopirellula marina]